MCISFSISFSRSSGVGFVGVISSSGFRWLRRVGCRSGSGSVSCRRSCCCGVGVSWIFSFRSISIVWSG